MIFKFDSVLARSKRITTLPLPLPDGQVLHFKADIINGDIPLLLGLDAMHKRGLINNFSKGIVKSNYYDWTLPIHYNKGYALSH